MTARQPLVLQPSAVYRIVHRDSGRNYVGSSKNVGRRFAIHLSDLRLGRHHSSKLQHAWDKHGELAFDLLVIECCEPARLLEREQHWIDAFDSFRCGYNARPRAESRLGAKATPELRAKLSRAHAGKRLTESHRAALAAALRRPEVRAKISASLKGRVIPEASRRNMAAAKLGNKNAVGTKRDPSVIAAHAELMRGNQFGKGFKLTHEMLAKRALRRGIPWSASRRAKYEASLVRRGV